MKSTAKLLGIALCTTVLSAAIVAAPASARMHGMGHMSNYHERHHDKNRHDQNVSHTTGAGAGKDTKAGKQTNGSNNHVSYDITTQKKL